MKRKLFDRHIMYVLFIVLAGLISCKKEDPGPPQTVINLSVTPTEITFEAEGGSSDIQITSNVAWTLTDTSDWCTESILGSEGDTTVTITALPNETTVDRTNTIIISAEDTIREVVITQEGIELLEVTYDIPPDNTDMRDITSIEIAQEMGVGWNVGNSLDAVGGETSWGNPVINETLIDAVKAAGFNAVRIPVAWSKFSDEENFVIEASWLERVEEVVNYVLDNDMYAIINIHWDEGWIVPTYEEEEYVTHRLETMWNQIATYFRDYDDHLLFAGTNEVMVEGDYGAPTTEYRTVQNGYNQTFVETVRATGGRNAYRFLVVQGFNTNIDYTVDYAVMPKDVLLDRLMMEVHYYDPYNFTLNENSNITQWGEIATEPSQTETWANESWADEQFQLMKTHFVDEGIAVLLGEYGAIARLTVDGHETYREYYTEYITQSIVDHGLVPFYWDNGFTGNNGFGLFDRSTGDEVYPEIIDAITDALE